MFKCFPIPFCNKSREQIDKRHCNLTTVPDHVLRHTRTLEELLLDANQLQYLPAVRRKTSSFFYLFIENFNRFSSKGRLFFDSITSFNVQ